MLDKDERDMFKDLDQIGQVPTRGPLDYAAYIAGGFVLLILVVGLLWPTNEDGRQASQQVYQSPPTEHLVFVGREYTTKTGTFAGMSRMDLQLGDSAAANQGGDGLRRVVSSVNTAFVWRSKRSVTVTRIEGGGLSPTHLQVQDSVTGQLYWTYPSSIE